jgi:dirigent-like protein
VESKVVRLVAVVVSLALLVVGALSIQAALAITQARTFTVVAPDAEQKQIDLGKRGPSLGDLFVFSGPLQKESGAQVGRIDGQCTTTSAPGPSAEQRQLCIVNITFENRSPGTEIDAQGVGRVEAEDVVLAVTGGTGLYQNARGQATFDFRSADRVVITYELIP